MHRSPSATIICGNAGVGKTTLARQRATELGATLIDIDTCTERLAKVALRAKGLDPEDRDSTPYKQLLRDAVYETLFDIAAENLKHHSCIIVGPFTRERLLPDWPQVLESRLEAAVHIVYVHCDEDVRRARIVRRGNPRDARKLMDWPAYATLGRDDRRPPFPHEWVDTTDSA